jgi:hypothetical protein
MINPFQHKPARLFLTSSILLVIITGFIVRPAFAANTAASNAVFTNETLDQIERAMQDNAAKAPSSNQAGIQILQGIYGANGSWRDVTDILQKSIKDDALQVAWQQPYAEIGGDPAWLKVKTLVISYRIDGKIRIATFQEQNPPVGLRAKLP